ncbi:MAG: hypothetical protein RIR26_313 [Pseudomonadota bacterium]
MNDLSRTTRRTDVIIVGGSPFGWACAHMLSLKKIKTTLVDDRAVTALTPWQSKGLGVFWSSLNDPPTRAVVAHGSEMAQWLQRVCVEGIRVAQSVVMESEFMRARALRIGLEKHEITELNAARDAHLGLASLDDLGPAYFCESEQALILSHPNQPLKTKTKSTFTKTQAEVSEVKESKDGCTVILANGDQLHSEIVILANGYKMAALQPWLAPMLVPMSDVQSEWSTNIRANRTAEPWVVRTASGHVAALISACQSSPDESHWRIKLTGPRFFLPQAGVGTDLSHKTPDSELQAKLERWLKEKLIPALLPLMETPPDVDSRTPSLEPWALRCEGIQFGVDCLPCDELPIAGELGLQGRILGSTGWLGCGWSAGFQMAQVVAELVEQGRSGGLAPLVQPKRWRSGMNDGVTGMT